MYIMTERGYQPLWSLGPVTVEPLAFPPISGKFKDYDNQGNWIGERAEIDSARKLFTTQQKAIVQGLREAWELKRSMPKTVQYAVSRFAGRHKMYLAGVINPHFTPDDSYWRYEQSPSCWASAKPVLELFDGEFITVREVQ